MKVLNLSYDDYANFAFENCKALTSIGVEAISLKRVRHPFAYEGESLVATADLIRREIKKADLIQLFHSDSTWLDYANELGKRVVVYHTGTTYRQNPDHCNKIFNDKVERCFTDQCEFIGLGMKNETYIATAINTDKFRPCDRVVKSPYIVAHYPSNPDVKGSATINRMMGEIEAPPHLYTYSPERVNHKEQMERMNACDIYVELFAPTQNGKPYGCFGVTAFEAAALGKIVITNNINEQVYKDVYGGCPMFLVHTESEFKNLILDTLKLSPTSIKTYQQLTRSWVVSKHSYIATGKRLQTLLNL